MATDILNDAYDNLVAKLQAISGLRVSSDPRNINPPTVFVQAPSATLNTNGVYRVEFGVQVIGLGYGDRQNLDKLLELVDKIRVERIGLTAAIPTTVTIGQQEFAAYDLTIATKIGP